jgi:hypothetical protein
MASLPKPTISKVDIRFIPEAEMRQPGLGDWWFEDGVLHIRATTDSEETRGDCKWAFLIALHEMVEAMLCRAHGVSQEAVDEFDLLFDSEEHDDEDEPGDDRRAPYRKEHRAAMLIEHMMAHFLGVTNYGTIR